MKSTIYLLTALLLGGCSDKKETLQSDKSIVFVSIIPQAGLAKALAGDLIDIHTLVEKGQSPHAYEPTASQMVKLGQAAALLTIGVPFERHLLKKITALYPEIPIIRTQHGIELRSMTHEHHDESCSHAHAEKDPHVWLAPTNLTIMARNMCSAFEKLDPPHAARYRENLLRITQRLKRLDSEIRTQLDPYSGRRIYVFHPSFGYFCEAYNLEQIPVELDGKSPSPRQLVSLIEQAKKDDVNILFVQQQFPAESARAIANAIGGRVVSLDPLAEDSIANLLLFSDSICLAFKK